MNPQKKQTTQLIVLGVLLAGFAGYVAFSLMGKKAAPKPQTAAAPSRTATGQAMTPEAEPTRPAVEFDYTAIPAGTKRDPFEPAFAATPSEQAPVVRAPIKDRRTTVRMRGPVVPPIGVGVAPIPPLGGIGTGMSGPPPDPEFQVSGVVMGDKRLAIMRAGEQDRLIVGEGQRIAGEYQVVSVTTDKVVLRHEGRKISVKLGGTKNAK